MLSGLVRNLEKFKLNFRYAFIPGKPLLTLRLVVTFLKIFLSKARPLRYVDFAVDYTCNLKCEHCFKVSLEEESDTDKKRLTVADYERITKEAMSLGAVNFSFQGGEFVLYKDWENVVRACQPEKNIISITTNGTRLTEENLDKMRRAGVDILTISLDSGIAEEHDHFRGVKGTFDKVMKGMDLALKKGFRVTVGSTVSHANLHSEGTKLLIDMAKKRGVILNLILAVPAGRWQDNEDILLTDEDMAFVNKLTASSPYIRTDFEANFVHWGCGALKEILYLTPYGDVLSCPFMHISFGNAHEESIETIRARGLKNQYFKEYYKKCLVAEDKEFIDKYMSQTYGRADLPVRDTEVFK